MQLDAIFEGTPEDRFLEMLSVADPLIAQEEIMQLIHRMAALEVLLEDEDVDSRIREASLSRMEEIQERRMDFLIGAMARIASGHER